MIESEAVERILLEFPNGEILDGPVPYMNGWLVSVDTGEEEGYMGTFYKVSDNDLLAIPFTSDPNGISNAFTTAEHSDLAHYGIPGMKWGKRKARRKNPKQRVNAQLKNMSDQELQQRLNRLRNEEAYRQMTGVSNYKSTGDKIKDHAKKSASKATGAAVSAGAAYVTSKVLIPTATVVATGYTLKKNMNL